MRKSPFVIICSCVLFSLIATGAPPRISDDRDLKELDLSTWDCRDRPDGSGKTPDTIELSREKNRSAVDLATAHVEAMDSAAFLQHVASFDAQTLGKHRVDLPPPLHAQLEQLEKQVVSLTGYVGYFYAGPPETTNCGSTDFHDWHLEVFPQPIDHPPRPGDPTPIICEVAPRTQDAIYLAGIRLQALAAYFRTPEIVDEPTGHPALKVRITGNLMWDEDHNGKADIGPTVQSFTPNKYHHPWRETAWEIHPITKIEVIGTP